MKGGNKMKANELRIGNLVRANYRGLSFICDVIKIIYNEISVKGISAQMGFDCRMDDDKSEYIISGDPEKYAGKENGFEPISLTEEWLMNLGFKKDKYWRPNNLDYYHSDLKEFCIISGQVRLYTDDPYEFFEIPQNIQFVHQLQNLYFAITGEELTIKS